MFNKMLSIAIALVIALTFMYANAAKAQSIVTEGLVSYWSFDEADIAGDTAKDGLGENDGTITGDPQIVDGKVRQALDFDGEDDNVAVDNSDGQFDLSKLTFVVWVKPEWNAGAPACNPGILGIRSPDVTRISLHIRSGYDAFDTWNNSSVGAFNYSFESGNWYHIAVTWDGNDETAYINGELINTIPNKNVGTTENLPLNIGSSCNAGCEFFNGLIDEVAIYNRALSEDEVNQNMNAEGMAVVAPAGKLASIWGKIKYE